MKRTITVAILALLLSLGVLPSLSIGDEQSKERSDIALEIKTMEVMIDQLEKMPRATKEEANAWAQLWMDIHDRFIKAITYDMYDNLNLWKLVGRWATAEGVSSESPYANSPFFHIGRLRPDYQKDEELIHLMAKLNAIRNKNHEDLEIDGYRNFVYLFEECDIGDSRIQLLIGRAYNNGHGLWCNRAEALKWYKRAAEAGNADALGELGAAYIYGSLYGLETNVETGVKLLNEAAIKGSASAAYRLGLHYVSNSSPNEKSDRQKAIEMFLVAAERHHYEAIAALAREYVNIGNGKEALRWADGGDEPNVSDKVQHSLWKINRSAADGQGACSYIKGEVYALGIGEIKQDLTLAKELFEESYRKGSAKGAQALAAMYREGIGVETDSALAEQWKSKAVNVFEVFGVDPRVWHERKIKAFAEKLRKASKNADLDSRQ